MVRASEPNDCYMTGADLLAELTTEESNEDVYAIRSHALGYISAVVDSHQLFHMAEDFPPVFCFPDVNLGEVASLLADALSSEPDLLDANAASLIVRVLRTNFPAL